MQNVCVLFTYILIVGEGNRRWCQHNFINMGSGKRNSRRAPLCLSRKQQEYPGGERQEDDGDDEEQDHHQQDQAQSHSQQ